MKKIISVALMTMASIPMSANAVNPVCKRDSFKFEGDKQVHMIYSAGIGAAARSVIKSPELAFAVALAPGLYREMFNSNSCFSKEDMVYNAVGALVGVYTTHWVLTPNRVVFNLQF